MKLWCLLRAEGVEALRARLRRDIFNARWLADRVLGIVPTFLIACVLQAIALFTIPYVGLVGLEIAAAVIGAASITAFVVWITVPGQHSSAFHISDIPTAAGLMLTIVAIGGAVIPPLYGQIAANWTFTAAWTVAGILCLGFAPLALFALSRQRAIATAPLASAKQ